MRVRLTVIEGQCKGAISARARLSMGVSASKPLPISQPARPGRARDAEVAKTATSASRTARLVDGRRISSAAGASVDARIHAITELQRGRVSRARLLALGTRHDAIAR